MLREGRGEKSFSERGGINIVFGPKYRPLKGRIIKDKGKGQNVQYITEEG